MTPLLARANQMLANATDSSTYEWSSGRFKIQQVIPKCGNLHLSTKIGEVIHYCNAHVNLQHRGCPLRLPVSECAIIVPRFQPNYRTSRRERAKAFEGSGRGRRDWRRERERERMRGNERSTLRRRLQSKGNHFQRGERSDVEGEGGRNKCALAGLPNIAPSLPPSLLCGPGPHTSTHAVGHRPFYCLASKVGMTIGYTLSRSNF